MSGSTSDLMGYYSFKKKSNNLINYCSLIKKNPAIDGLQFIRKKKSSHNEAVGAYTVHKIFKF